MMSSSSAYMERSMHGEIALTAMSLWMSADEARPLGRFTPSLRWASATADLVDSPNSPLGLPPNRPRDFSRAWCSLTCAGSLSAPISSGPTFPDGALEVDFPPPLLERPPPECPPDEWVRLVFV